MAASPTVNTPVFDATTQTWDFSDSSDNINLENFAGQIGKAMVRMFAGNDTIRLSKIVRGGFDNVVLGNLGNDQFFTQTGDGTRALVKGNADDDFFNLTTSIAGGDWVHGGAQNDTIFGGFTPGGQFNVLIGGTGLDRITGMGGNDVLIGGPDKDILRSGLGSNVFVLNTADFVNPEGQRFQNAAQNPGDADEIVDYAPTFDRIVIPGVASIQDLNLTAINANTGTLISSGNLPGSVGQERFIGKVLSANPDQIRTATINGMGLVVGDKADAFTAQITVSGFESNATFSFI